MTRLSKLVAIAALAISVFAISGCQPQVEVKTGTRVVCTQGHLISEDVETVKVPANEVSQYRIKTVVETCPEHAALEKLYSEAQVAIAAGDIETASTKLAEVVAADPAYRQAQDQLTKIKSGSKPKPDTEPAPEPTPPSDPADAKPGEGDTSAPAASLLVWAPDKVEGFTSTKAIIDLLNIARDYVPKSGSDVRSMVIVAEQTQTAAAAAQALDVQVKQKYASDKASVTVNGHKAYFGTDGRAFAAIGFTQGSVMVAVEMSPASGSPKALKDDLVRIVEQLP